MENTITLEFKGELLSRWPAKCFVVPTPVFSLIGRRYYMESELEYFSETHNETLMPAVFEKLAIATELRDRFRSKDYGSAWITLNHRYNKENDEVDNLIERFMDNHLNYSVEKFREALTTAIFPLEEDFDFG
jgi:hypothetical protein